MKRKNFKIIFEFLPILVFFSATWGYCEPVNLQDSFQAALKNGETFQIQTENIIQAHENVTQAGGALFPQINGSASYFLQQNIDNGTSIYPTTQPLIKVTADQPLFRGLREWAAIRQRNRLEESTLNTRQQVGIQLLEDTATGFYTVLMYEQDVRNFNHEIEQTKVRIGDLNAFRKIGRARNTDVLTLEASLASVEAQKETSVGLLAGARQTFAYLTGLPATTPLADNEPNVSTIGPPEAFMARIEMRPDIKAAVQTYEASGENVDVIWGQHLPSADLIGDYYFLRSGALQNVSWDAEVALSIPIFTGGVIQSQVRQAKSQERQADLTLSRTRRLAVQQIDTFYVSTISDQNEVIKLLKAADLSNRSYQAEVKDYRNGLVTNLDVLQALTTAQENERLLDRARYTLKTDYLKLQASSQNRKEISLIP